MVTLFFCNCKRDWFLYAPVKVNYGIRDVTSLAVKVIRL